MTNNTLNTNIYKDPYEEQIMDLSFVGISKYDENNILINQTSHGFRAGEVLYYNISLNKFDKALAINAIESEVCGVVSEVTDFNNFVIATEGFVETDMYDFEIGQPLYLSENSPGKLQSINPIGIVKQIATQTSNGIIVDIQRGFKISDTQLDFSVEPYTKEELDEIIKNVW